MLTGSMWLVFCWIIFYNVMHPCVMGKPTFTIPSLASLTGFAGFGTGNSKSNDKEHTGKNADSREDHIDDRVKPYSGLRVRNDSIRMVYYHDQTIAIAEIGPGKLLLNCELIEVIEPDDAAQTLRKLSSISRPLTVTLEEMLTLMKQCEMIEESTMRFMNKNFTQTKAGGSKNSDKNSNAIPNAPRGGGLLAGLGSFSLFSGIVPGTKWCGTGDIAENYHDLGPDAKVDRCCRTHDICPVKISSSSQRYNLSNPSIVTKSYCKCDDMLFECLKESNSTTGEILGNIYFNIVQVPCIEDFNGKRHFRKSRNNF